VSIAFNDELLSNITLSLIAGVAPAVKPPDVIDQ